jgi:hypothetical protein
LPIWSGKKPTAKINIKPYFGSALLKGAQLKSAQMVAKGVIDCAYESTINISPVIPEANIFHLPFFHQHLRKPGQDEGRPVRPGGLSRPWKKWASSHWPGRKTGSAR